MKDTLLVGGVSRCQSREGVPDQDLLGLQTCNQI